MTATLRIHHDGVLVLAQPVTCKSEVWAAMAEFPPPQARGSVVSLDGKPLALSGHSTAGPTWGMVE